MKTTSQQPKNISESSLDPQISGELRPLSASKLDKDRVVTTINPLAEAIELEDTSLTATGDRPSSLKGRAASINPKISKK